MADEKLDRVHSVQADVAAVFTWDYDQSRVPLIKLYEKAKTSQWNASTDLDWSIDVDPEKVADELGQGGTARFQALAEAEGSPVKHFGDKEWRQVGVELQNSLLSQFMHGEQGALLCTARIVETVPWIDAKYYAATQVVDEARHVEVFARYLDDKLGTQYGINENLKGILDDILSDPRWDIAYLGMQIVIESLALAAFGSMHRATEEPLLKKLLRYVMSDEARHVAFGVLTLAEYYQGLTSAELRDRQDFLLDATIRNKARSTTPELWERLGVDLDALTPFLLEGAATLDRSLFTNFEHGFFSKLVPNVRKLGLLDANDSHLRKEWEKVGIMRFDDGTDTAEDYESYDAVAQDRAATS